MVLFNAQQLFCKHGLLSAYVNYARTAYQASRVPISAHIRAQRVSEFLIMFHYLMLHHNFSCSLVHHPGK